ncbi:transferrin-binding protein-like solute binding protein [Novosphingobium sp.]|uniref:transferrin-binding protein-like solute binding protein n=1 Tax=Novosphingobium sp. TaxID=1874826 RepID=UPI0026216567|nr:transferrin-binding protein-like solute binding protein [Novosphingobium sp.]
MQLNSGVRAARAAMRWGVAVIGIAAPAVCFAADGGFIGTLSSQTFPADAIRSEATWPPAGPDYLKRGQVSSAEAASVIYNAATGLYTVKTGATSTQLGPASVATAESTTTYTAYRVGGDLFALSKPGTSGPRFQYVGQGFRLHIKPDGAVEDNFTYGFVTPAAALPRSGRAEYALVFSGHVHQAEPKAAQLAGTGSLRLDFATGGVVLNGRVGPSTYSPTAYVGIGFSGHIDSTGHFASSIDKGNHFAGRFYGPAAQEVGGVFAATDGATTPIFTYSGTFAGRGGLIANVPFVAANANADVAPGTAPIEVRYDATKKIYTLIEPTRSYSGKLNQYITWGPSFDDLHTVLVGRYNSLKALYWGEGSSSELGVPGAASTGTIHYLVTGDQTPFAALPRTGSAGFKITLAGTLSDPALPTFHALKGAGTLFVNFGDGSVKLTGTTSVLDPFSGTLAGTFAGTGKLGAGTSALTGPVKLDGFGSYTGSWQGHLYGPTAGEVGGAFNVLSANGKAGVMGALFGKYAAGLVDKGPARVAYTPLTAWMSGTQGGVDANVLSNFDPATGITRIRASFLATPFATLPDIVLQPGSIDAAAGSASYTVYKTTARSTAGTYAITARQLKTGPDNPLVKLTYLSFYDVSAVVTTQIYSDAKDVHFIALAGVATPFNNIPTTGKAVYNGIVAGRAVSGTDAAHPWSVTGKSTFSVDFFSNAFTAALTMSAQRPGSSNHAFAAQNFATSISLVENGFSASNSTGGYLAGKFYGPSATEIGAAAGFGLTDAAGPWRIAAVAVAGR